MVTLPIWVTAAGAILITLLSVYLLGTPNPYLSPSIFAVILGISYMVYGQASKRHGFIFCSIGWWIGAGFLFAHNTVENLLLFAFLILALLVIPEIVQLILRQSIRTAKPR
jgi:hypothetical protein